MHATLGRATTRPPLEDLPALQAPLFRQLLEQRRDDERHVILDLGATSSPMLELLGRCPCHVQVADIVTQTDVGRLNGAEPGEALDTLAASMLPAHCAERPVDIVLCWDLPNYLSPPALDALMRAIAARSRVGAMAHALLVYADRTMPDHPRRYVPLRDGRLLNHATPGRAIDAPRYSPEALGGMIGPFRIDRARLLGNGMQEFLFVREESAH